MLAPINSIKHYVQTANTGITSGNAASIVLVNAVVAPAAATTADVIQGAVIKAIYVEFWLGGDATSGTESQFVVTMEKKKVEETDPTAAELLNLGSYSNKKNVLYTTQGIVSAMLDGGITIPVFKGWVKIPRGKQRFGLEDEFVFSITAVGNLRLCGFATYKEYR